MAVKMNGNQIKERGVNRLFSLTNGILLFLFMLIELYPLVYVVSASVSDPKAVTSGTMWLFPVNFNLEGYKYILHYKELWIGYANTIVYTLLGTGFNLLLTLPAGYAFSRKDFKDSGILMVVFVITMYFGGGLIPSYLNIYSMGLVNTRLILIILGGLNVYNMLVARTFFANSIPWELHEAATIDGASNSKIFFSIVLPLSKPIIAVMALYYGVGHWNEYFSAMIYVANDRRKWPLQLFLREILNQSKWAANALLSTDMMTAEEMEVMIKQAETANVLKYCVIVASTLPMLIVYPRLQKFFNKGVMVGSVKG